MPFFKGPEIRSNQSLFTFKARPHPAGGYTIGRIIGSRLRERLTSLRSNNKIRYFMLYLVSAVVIVVGFTIFYLNFAKGTSAAWFDDSYSYRQKVTVTNSGSDQTDYQVSFTLDTTTLIAAGKMQSDCDDIRVTELSGKLLRHVIEEGSAPCGNAATKIWVKPASIPTSGVILYVYYGNPSVNNYESGEKVFAFFDNFNAGFLNSNKWSTTDTVTFSGGAITITLGSVYSNSTILSSSQSYMYEYRRKISSTVSDYSGLSINNTQSGIGNNTEADKLIYMISNSTSSIAQRGFANDTGTGYNLASNMTLYTPTADTYYIDGFSLDGTEIKFYSDGTQKGTTATGTWTGSPGPYMILGNYWGSTAVGRAATDITVDWVRARKYASTAPSASASGEEKAEAPQLFLKFDEGNGTSTNDSSPNNNDGSISGSAWKTSELCMSGNCLYYDGSDDVVTVTNADSIDLDRHLAGALTFSAWIRPNGAGEGTGGQIFFKGTNTWLRVDTLSSGKLDIQASLDLGTTDATLNVSAVVNDNQWNHVAMSYTDDGDDEITLWVNGRSVGSSTDGVGAPASDANNLLIGGTTTNNFKGFIDDLKVYKTEKSADQIKAIAQKLAGSEGSGAVFGLSDTSILSNGLVGYWRMDESSWTNDCSTDSAMDSSGNGSNGDSCPASTGPTGGGTGKFGNGGNFDGISDYIKVSDNDNLDLLTRGITVSAWVNVSASDAKGDMITIKGGGNPTSIGYLFGIKPSDNEVRLMISDGSSYIVNTNSTAVVADNTWKHVAFTWDPKVGAKIFINGTLDTEVSASSSVDINNGGALFIGGYSSTDYTLIGSMDDVRIYNRALTPAEVSQLYNWAPGQVGWWKMDEAFPDTCTGGANDSCDSSGFGYDGAWNGNATSTTGKFGLGVTFDGTGDYVDAGDIGL